MTRTFLMLPVLVAAFAVAGQSAGAATLPMPRPTDRVGASDGSKPASKRPNEASAIAPIESGSNSAGALYSPFAEVLAKPARQGIQASKAPNAEEADLTLSVLAALAAIGALSYLVRRA